MTTDENTVPDHGGGSGHAPHPVPFVKGKRASTPDDDETWKEGEVAPTLNSFDNAGESRATVVAVEAAGGDLPPEGVLAFGRQEDRLAGAVYEDEVPGLTTSKTYAVAVPAEAEGVDLLNQTTTGDVMPTVCGGSGGGNTMPHTLTPDLAVRRLTPRECERLMGWPDDWTRWAADGSEVADSSRYRMCGNGVASPVAEWIGRCIVAAEQEMGE